MHIDHFFDQRTKNRNTNTEKNYQNMTNSVSRSQRLKMSIVQLQVETRPTSH